MDCSKENKKWNMKKAPSSEDEGAGTECLELVSEVPFEKVFRDPNWCLTIRNRFFIEPALHQLLLDDIADYFLLAGLGDSAEAGALGSAAGTKRGQPKVLKGSATSFQAGSALPSWNSGR